MYLKNQEWLDEEIGPLSKVQGVHDLKVLRTGYLIIPKSVGFQQRDLSIQKWLNFSQTLTYFDAKSFTGCYFILL